MFEMSHLNSVGDIQIRERDVGLRNLSACFPATRSPKRLPSLLRSGFGVGGSSEMWSFLPLEKRLAHPHYKASGVKR